MRVTPLRALLVVGGFAAALAGCGASSGGGGNGQVPASWQKVDSCLEQHPSFVGNVVGDDTSGPGAKGIRIQTMQAPPSVAVPSKSALTLTAR
jgi:hypothetical protein